LSINDNHTYGSCAFYVEQRQVNYDRELGKEGREREIYDGLGREGENGHVERK
jgi:hypothetical protein